MELNELITEDTVIFDAPGGPYTIEVHKGQKTSQIGGDEWNRFINHMHLGGGELISFSFRRQTPRLYAKGIRLSDDESSNLWYILPPCDDYVGMPFLTHLTRTNVNRHVVVCYFRGGVSHP